MKVSLAWIRQLLGGSELDPEVVAEKLTMSGTEVEGITHHPAPGERVIVAEVVESSHHPSAGPASPWKVLHVWNGQEKIQVVCGAPNTPGKGAKVVLAGEGSVVRGKVTRRREFDGVVSAGILCSEDELGIGPDTSGIILLDPSVKAGTPLRAAFALEDWIMDLAVTPNRPDLLGHIGVAREIAMLVGLEMPKLTASNGGETAWEEVPEEISSIVNIEIRDTQGCPRYTAAVVRGATIAPSPLEVRVKLHRLGVRSISNAVDVTSWILLLHNQPLHAFDLRRLAGRTIIVRRASDGEKITTLDGIERTLGPEDLVIADKVSPVAIAGIMGGEGSEILDATTEILIECAYFDPPTIRRTSSRHRLTSESSYRFERGIDPQGQIRALQDALAMMCRLTGGKAARGLIDLHPNPQNPPTLRLRASRIRKILGTDLGWNAGLGVLRQLGCQVEEVANGNAPEAKVTVPSFRPDLTREIDLIEELARTAGYDKIPATGPVIQVTAPQRGSYDLMKAVRTRLAAGGFTEVVNLSLVSDKKQKIYFPSEEAIRVTNPLTSERDVMRLSLLPGLLDNLVYWITWKEKGVRIFEVGTVFYRAKGGIVEGVVERSCVGALAYGPIPGWIGEKRGEANFYEISGLLSHLCEGVWHCKPVLERFAEEKAPPFLAPASACGVEIFGERCGFIGELHPAFLEKLDLPAGKAGKCKVALFEIKIPMAKPRPRRFKAISPYPSSERDLSMVFGEEISAGEVSELIRREGGDLVESVRLFDLYRSKGIEPGKKSMAFSITYRSNFATLTSEEVDSLHRKIVSVLETRLGGRLR